jgi:PAS domain S-box-containing protein
LRNVLEIHPALQRPIGGRPEGARVTTPLRLLLVEDTQDDADLLLRELRRGSYAVAHRRVETAGMMQEALEREPWDLVISDWTLPTFSAPEALAVLLKTGLDLPFIIVSGAIGEDVAVHALKAGAHDFMVKDRLTRLVPAVERELREAEVRRSERRAREALVRSERLLRLVTDSVPDGIVASDADGEITLSNAAARRLLGDRTPDAAGESLPDLHTGLYLPDGRTACPGKDLPLTRALCGETVEAQELVVGEGTHARRISMAARPMHDDALQLQGAVSVIRDITNERGIQQQLMVSDRMASVGMLAAGVAHEINNPLASLLVNVQLALETVQRLGARLPEDAQELVDELRDAHEAGSRILTIVHDIKAFCHTDSQEAPTIQLAPVLDSAIRMAWNQVRQRAELVRSYAETPHVRANEARLCQVFLNLLVNAVQALPDGNREGHRIEVATRVAPDGRVVAEIKDTGTGMPPEVLQRLFTPFFTTKPAGIGTGLGLSISQRIVKSLGGEIQVESELGRGTTFRVCLLAGEPKVAPAPVAPPPARSAGGQGRVLAVDDEPLVTGALRRMLRQHDFHSENSPRAALERLRTGERFDVILCDLMMPEMTGMDLLAELERVAPDQARRVIFLTGGAVSKRAAMFLGSVKNLCLEKPFNTEKLRALVSSRIG